MILLVGQHVPNIAPMTAKVIVVQSVLLPVIEDSVREVVAEDVHHHVVEYVKCLVIQHVVVIVIQHAGVHVKEGAILLVLVLAKDGRADIKTRNNPKPEEHNGV